MLVMTSMGGDPASLSLEAVDVTVICQDRREAETALEHGPTSETEALIEKVTNHKGE